MIRIDGIVRILSNSCRALSSSHKLYFPRKNSLVTESQERWKKYVETIPEGEEAVAPTTFGTVRMDTMNKLKYHGAYDEEMKKVEFDEEEGEDKVQLWTPNRNKTFDYDTSNEGLYIENFSSRPEDKIPEIGDVPKVTSTKKSSKQGISQKDENSMSDMHLTQKISFSNEEKNWAHQNKANITAYQDLNMENYNSSDSNFENKMNIKLSTNTKIDKSDFKSGHKEKSEHKHIKKDTSAIQQTENEPPTMNAFEYIKQMQKENFEQEKLREIQQPPMSKEIEVKQLGQGVQKRINFALGSANSALTKSVPRNKSEDNDETFKNDDGLLRLCDPKYLPVDLNKLSSVEVMEILEKGIIYDKHDIVVLNKPFGFGFYLKDSVHSLEKYLENLSKQLKCDKLYTVHRIDLNTTGIMLLAKSQESCDHLKKMFAERKIEKTYWTIVNGTPKPETAEIKIPICEANFNGRYRMTLNPDYKTESSLVKPKKFRNTSQNFPAVTHYKTLKAHGNAALLEVQPVTGYKHQVRVHLGLGLNTPVFNDHKYSYLQFDGKPQRIHGDLLNRLNVSRGNQSRKLPILLHAKSMIIPRLESNNQYIRIESKLPHHFVKIMKSLKLRPSKLVSSF